MEHRTVIENGAALSNNAPAWAQPKDIDQNLVLSQIDTNALRKEFGQVAMQAARVQRQMGTIDAEMETSTSHSGPPNPKIKFKENENRDDLLRIRFHSNNLVINQESLTAFASMRSYQSALVSLCIDGKIDIEKFAQHMQAAHAQFCSVEKQLENDKELTRQMLVDDWDSNHQSDGNNEEEQKVTAKTEEQQPRDSTMTVENNEEMASSETVRDEFSHSLLETIWMRRQLLDTADEGKIQIYYEKVKEIYQSLQVKSIVNSQSAHEILDRTTLEKIGLTSVNFMQRCMTRYRTLTFYAQKKFNLMREETEGFSKLIIELNQENIDSNTVGQVKENIQKLVGYFQLDPNRLLDLILSSFQNNVHNLTYLELIREFGQRDQVTQLMGFKIQHALRICKIGPDGLPAEPTKDSDDKEPHKSQFSLIDQSLFDLTALLIKHEVIALEDVWANIESKMDPASDEEKGDEIDQLNEMQAKSLEYLYELLFKVIMNAEKFESEMTRDQIEPKHIEIERKRAKMHCNFKIRLLQSCVRVNDWDTTDDIVNGIYDGKLDLTFSQPVLSSMFRALDWCVSKIYKSISPAAKILPNRFGNGKFQLKNSGVQYFSDESKRSIRQASNVSSDLFDDLQKVLRVLGIYLAFDEKVFLKVLKVIEYAIEQQPQFRQAAFQMASEIFVPAQALISTNYAIEGSIWAIFKHADFNARYICYTNMLKVTYLSQPCLVAKQIKVYKKCQKWAKRLVDQGEMRTKSKQFSRLCYGNSVLAFDLMVTNAKAYENQIEAQIQSISLCQDLALDQMAFMIVKHLADTTDPHLDGNQMVSKWLVNLTNLASQFFKKFSHVEIMGTFTYLTHKLREENSFVFAYMINQLVANMFGWQDLVINQLQPDQLNVLAAGIVLKLQGRNQSQQLRNNKKPTEALTCLFWDPLTNDHSKIGLRLMVQLAQQVQFVGNKFDTDKLILVARQYDKMQVYFSHMVDTLFFLAQSQKKFSLLLPDSPARSLSYDYRLPPQHVFQILRCALPSIFKLTPELFTKHVSSFKEVLDLSWQSRLDAALNSENTQDNDYWDEMAFVQMKKEDLWRHLRPELYCIFWYLDIRDLAVPRKLYEDEIKSVQNQIKKLNDQVTQLKSNKMPLDAIRATSSDNVKETLKKSLKEIEKLTRSQKALQSEFEGQSRQYKDTFTFLQQKIPDLFKNEETSEAKRNNMQELSTVLIQYCFFPRLMHSAKDALFSLQFCKLLHKLRVPNFNFLSFFGQILKCIVPAIHFCSEEEAENLGIFFLELFKLLHHWSKKEIWDKECEGYGGFARKFVDPTMCITHQEFVDKIIHSIIRRISAAMIHCFDKSEKMHMKARCALIILNRVSPVFPNLFTFAKAIQQKLQTLVDAKEGINQDLKTLAGRLNAKLKQKVASFPEHAAEEKAKKEVAAAAKAKEEKEKKEKERQNGSKSSQPASRNSDNKKSSTNQKDTPSKNSSSNKPTDKGGRSSQPVKKGDEKNGGRDQSSSNSKTNNGDRKGNDQDSRGDREGKQSGNQRATESGSVGKQDASSHSSRKVSHQKPNESASQQHSGVSKPKAKADEKDKQAQNRQVLQVTRHKQPNPEVSSQSNQAQNKKPITQREETKSTGKQQTTTSSNATGKRQASSSQIITQKDDHHQQSPNGSSANRKEPNEPNRESFKDPSQSKRPRNNAQEGAQQHQTSQGKTSAQSQMLMRDNQSLSHSNDAKSRGGDNSNGPYERSSGGGQRGSDNSQNSNGKDRDYPSGNGRTGAAQETQPASHGSSGSRTGVGQSSRRGGGVGAPDDGDHYYLSRGDERRHAGNDSNYQRNERGGGVMDRNEPRGVYHEREYNNRSTDNNQRYEQIGNYQGMSNQGGRERTGDAGRHNNNRMRNTRSPMSGGAAAGNRSPRRANQGGNQRAGGNDDYFSPNNPHDSGSSNNYNGGANNQRQYGGGNPSSSNQRSRR